MARRSSSANLAFESEAFSTKELFREHRRANFRVVREAIDRMPVGALTPGLVNLRGRLYARQDPANGIVFMTRQASKLQGRPLAEATMITGVLHARARDEKGAEASFALAEKMMRSGRDRALLEELAYHREFAHWIFERPTDADAVSSLRNAASPDVRIRGRILESVIANREYRYLEQAAFSFDAFVMALENDDVELQAYTALNVSTLARELALPQLREAVKSAVERIQWTDDLRNLQFQSLKATGWCCALDGDYFNAFRLFKAASNAAPSPHWRVIAALDRAYLARCLGERRWAEQELLEADSLARTLDWHGLSQEEHLALISLAELHADVDAAVSLGYLARFRELGQPTTLRSTYAHNPLPGAGTDYSTGIVHARLGNADEAIAALGAAWEVYDRVNYDWRAGRCALELHALTGDPVWRERAAAKLRGYEKSWLAPALTVAPAESEALNKLTPAQRRVFDMLVAGKPTEEIAARLGRSVFTVRNHIKAIFIAFDVNSRAALVAEAARKKLIA